MTDPRVRVLPNAISLERFRQLDDKRENFRQSSSLPGGYPLLGHIGSFRPQKNHVYLLKLLSRLLDDSPSAQLVLVGDGGLRGHLEELVRRQNLEAHVHFLGIRTDVARLLSAFDLFLFPSRWEGLGIVVVEAQAAGTASVVSDAVPDEADLRLNLVRRVSLKASKEVWIDAIHDQLNVPSVPWPVRAAALKRDGYDVTELADMLQQVYSNAESYCRQGAVRKQ